MELLIYPRVHSQIFVTNHVCEMLNQICKYSAQYSKYSKYITNESTISRMRRIKSIKCDSPQIKSLKQIFTSPQCSYALASVAKINNAEIDDDVIMMFQATV